MGCSLDPVVIIRCVSVLISVLLAVPVIAGSHGYDDLLHQAAPDFSVKSPYIDVATSPNVTEAVGKTALLLCRVRALGNRTVSWIRHRDLYLLAVGHDTYTTDPRIQAVPNPAHSEDWALQIRSVRPDDEGIYECQAAISPHVGHLIFLNVVVPSTNILGSPELHIDRGSTINLTCVVRHSPEPPAHVFWSHNEQVIAKGNSSHYFYLGLYIATNPSFYQVTAFDPPQTGSWDVTTVNYDSSRGGISVLTEKGEITTSSLLIQKARPSDSGVYVCSPSSASSASVNVHVLEGETPAAMQTNSGGRSLNRAGQHVCYTLMTIFFTVALMPSVRWIWALTFHLD